MTENRTISGMQSAENSPYALTPFVTACEFNLLAHLHGQRSWSTRTFGPGDRAAGVVDHIRKELAEIEAAPGDLEEWIDVIILALDGAWRSGHTPVEIVNALIAKQAKNERRQWPDWRTAEPGKAIEHVRDEIRSSEAVLSEGCPTQDAARAGVRPASNTCMP